MFRGMQRPLRIKMENGLYHVTARSYMAMDQPVCHCLELNRRTIWMRQPQFQAVQSTVTTETRRELS